MATNSLPDRSQIDAFQRDGVVKLEGAFSPEWIDCLRTGLEHNIREPGPYRREYSQPGAPGHFFGDYCNWQRISEYRDFFFDSPAAAIAAALMGSRKVNLFHEHVIVKEPNTAERTPWHHDQPYYCVDGRDNCSLWIPLDPVARESCVEFVAGSHLWDRWFTPMKFVGVEYQRGEAGYESVPDIDNHRADYDLRSFELQPGDCIAFHFRTVHGAPGNLSGATRRRAFAARFTGDDASFTRRAGETSPPFEEVTLENGAPLDSQTFPRLLG